MKRILVWDLPTRIFHWLLTGAVIGAFVSVKMGGSAMIWHGRFGLCILGLLVFRIVWGVAGSTYVRFRQFVRGPATIKAYLRGEWRGEGHNPLGALSVLALLGTLSLLVATGLFSNDDIVFEGPLYALVDRQLSNSLSSIHRLVEPVIILLVVAHLGAIAFYWHAQKNNLIKPMVFGWKDVPEGDSATGGGIIALVASLGIAIAVVLLGSGIWIPAPPPPPATSAPAW